MANNLRSKISSSDKMFIHDVNPAVTEQFAKEVGNVEIAQSVRDVAENSVCLPRASYQHNLYDEPLFSLHCMI